MIIIGVIIAILIWGFYQFNKAANRAQAIIDGARQHENPNWQERLAIAMAPIVTEQNEKRRLKGSPAISTATYVDYSREGVGDRLELAFDRYRRKEINIWHYKDIVTDEDTHLRHRIEDLQYDKRTLPRADPMRECFDDDIEEARDALEETKWRLRWIKEREMDQGGDGNYSG